MKTRILACSITSFPMRFAAFIPTVAWLLLGLMLMALQVLPSPPADRRGKPEQPVPTVTPVWAPHDYF